MYSKPPHWKGTYDFTEISSYTYFKSKHDRTETEAIFYYVLKIYAKNEGPVFQLWKYKNT